MRKRDDMDGVRTFTADREGERLDRFLVRMEPNVSRSYIQKCLDAGKSCVNGKAAKQNRKLAAGDTVTFAMLSCEFSNILPEDIPLAVLYEDADIIVIDKARGMVVHPASGVYTGTLVNALLFHCKDLSGINGEIRPGIVHRLDKNTSGVMVAAKNDAAHLSLAKQIREKTAKRRYFAICHGNISEEAGTIKGAIGRHPTDRKKMAIVYENGKPAVTHFKVLKRYGDYTFLECQLETGRTHQIRVHLASIGHSLVSDDKYGPRKKSSFAIKGQALHSHTLSLTHPRTGKRMTFTAPVPSDMQVILDRLDKNYGKFS